jgi:hypothetical protein
MNLPNLPSKILKLRAVPILKSEVTSWNTEKERCTSHHEGQTIIVPSFITGDRVELIFSKHGNYAYVEDVNLSIVTELSTVFYSEKEAWHKACTDAVEASGNKNSIERLSGTIEIYCEAKELIESREWWTNDITRKWIIGGIQTRTIPMNTKIRSLFPCRSVGWEQINVTIRQIPQQIVGREERDLVIRQMQQIIHSDLYTNPFRIGAAISPRKTFYLWDSLSNAEVVFEIEPDSSVKQIWPVLGHTNLTKADLEKWLTKDLAEGRDSMCRQAR